jgi:signal peptidase II
VQERRIVTPLMATGLGRRPADEVPAASSGSPRTRGKGSFRRLAILAIAGLVLLVDQASKTWALHHASEPRHVVWTVRLAVTFNSGTAFGLGQDSTAIIVAGVVVLVVVLLGLGRKASRTATWPASVAMGALLGGALGNLADRLIRHHHGAVIDFIDLRWWPVFNVADAAITVGAALLALVLFRARSGAVSAAPAAPAPPAGTSAPAGGPEVGA